MNPLVSTREWLWFLFRGDKMEELIGWILILIVMDGLKKIH